MQIKKSSELSFLRRVRACTDGSSKPGREIVQRLFLYAPAGRVEKRMNDLNIPGAIEVTKSGEPYELRHRSVVYYVSVGYELFEVEIEQTEPAEELATVWVCGLNHEAANRLLVDLCLP